MLISYEFMGGREYIKNEIDTIVILLARKDTMRIRCKIQFILRRPDREPQTSFRSFDTFEERSLIKETPNF